VPLCRGHHRQLHQAGDEVAWWSNHHLEPLIMALRLWQQTRPLQATARQCSDAPPPDPQNTANRTGASSPVTIAVRQMTKRSQLLLKLPMSSSDRSRPTAATHSKAPGR
jgi:hypothetical protein